MNKFYYIHNQFQNKFAPERDTEGRVKFFETKPTDLKKDQVVCIYEGDFTDPFYINGIKTHIVIQRRVL